MLDHISLRVQDFDGAAAFYRAALAPIGYRAMMEFPGYLGLGSNKPDFWVTKTDKTVCPTHIAFIAERAQVDAFYAAAMAAGAKDNGPPGLRLDYHPHYYAAFVLDPEGNNIEVVCHAAPGAAKAKAKAKTPAKKAKAAKTVPAKKAPAKVKKAKPAKKAKRRK